jgi:hypothetical protein
VDHPREALLARAALLVDAPVLHSWDWLPLLQRRPLWDALLLAFSLGGLLLSATGVLIGLRRLRRQRSHRAQALPCLKAHPYG